MSEFSNKALSRVYLQYKNSPKLIKWLLTLPEIAQSNIVEQVEKIRRILDIDNAVGDQLDICGRIAGYRKRPSTSVYPGCVFGPVNDELYRVLIKAKIYRNNSIATIDEVKTAADYILDAETRCLDGQDMTMRMVWFTHGVSIPVQQLVRDYDLIPRPQGVGTREHRVLTYRPFGFGPHYANFRAPFWHGDGLHLYYTVNFLFSFDNDAGMLHGRLVSEEVVISNLDVKLTITDSDGVEKTVFAVTDENGEFSVQMEKTGKYTAVAQAQIITPDCAQAVVTSDPYDFRWHIYVTGITTSVAELEVVRGERATFTVDILPENATNKAFSVHLSDGTLADIETDGNQVTVFGLTKGAGEITVTALDTGMTATVPLNVVVVPETQFVMRIDSPSRPLFFVEDITEDFTIDYGDGVASRDYEIVTNTPTTGFVHATRELAAGQEYTLLVKRCESMNFYASASSGVAINSLLEIVRVSGERQSMRNFATGQSHLRKVHDGAFDELVACTNFTEVFYNCTSLEQLPAGLFANTQSATTFDSLCRNCASLTGILAGFFDGVREATSFRQAFYGCTKLTDIPDELFAGLDKVTTFSGVFRGCTSLVRPGDRLFKGCASVTDVGYLFYGCTSLVYPGEDILAGCTSANYFYSAFNGCRQLSALPDGLFADVPGGSFYNTFLDCTALTQLPAGLFRHCAKASVAEYTFKGCTSLESVPDGLFAGLDEITSFYQCFVGCTALKSVGDDAFRDCAAATNFTNIFSGCSSLVSVGENIFRGCTSVTTFQYAFYNCAALENMPLFTDCGKVLSLSHAFSGCVSLKAITEGAFEGKSLAAGFEAVFRDCRSVTSLPSGVFRGCSSAVVFLDAFNGCSALVDVAGDAFAGCEGASNLRYMFQGCNALMRLPEDLFADMVNVTSMNSVFYRCSALTDIPEGLLRHNEKLASVEYLFDQCLSLRDIPEGLFANNPLISSFAGTFRGTGVKSLPEGLFSHNVNATSFSATFSTCKALKAVPFELFRRNTLAAGFSSVFADCTALESVEGGLFDDTAAVSLGSAFKGCTRLGSSINAIFPLESYGGVTGVMSLFDGCRQVTGQGLKLIDALPSVGASAGYRGYAFRNCMGLDDYDDIPSDWK